MARRKEFSLENLKHLDGGLPAAMVDKLIKAAVVDCEERPGEPGKRTVTLTLEFVPVSAQSRPDVVDRVDVRCVMKGAAPARKTSDYQMKVHQDASLSFQPEDESEEGDGDEVKARAAKA